MDTERWLEPEGLALLEGWARAGLSDREIARRMGLRPGTLSRWRRRFPALAGALALRRTQTEDLVEDALLRKALGYESREVRVELSPKGERKEVTTVKQVGPDLSAISLWLKKRRPERWGDEAPPEAPENNLLALLGRAEGEVACDGIPELQPEAAPDHAVVAGPETPEPGRHPL